MLTLDGSTLEGGGQLVRVALSLSSICSIPIRVTNIRANRSSKSTRPSSKTTSNNPRHGRGTSSVGGGLKESHLAALNWLAEQCNADVHGNQVGCAEVMFKPSLKTACSRLETVNPTDKAPDFIALEKPGSVWLIWQAIFPYIALRLTNPPQGFPSQPPQPFHITLMGGTNVPKSPSTEYMQQVFLPLCEQIGLPKVDVRVIRRGWAGSASEIGRVELTVHPSTQPEAHVSPDSAARLKSRHLLAPFFLSRRGSITNITMTIISGSPTTQTYLQSDLRTSLSTRPIFSSVPITIHPSSGLSGDERRLYVLLVAHTTDGHRLGRDYLGPGRKVTSDADRRRVVAEAVAHVVGDFTKECESNASVDEFAEDQLVIFQALAAGVTNVEPRRVAQADQQGLLTRHPTDPGSKGGLGSQNRATGSLHTRTVRWVCEQMLGTEFDGHGGCKGIDT
ncbi:hypothetical protein PV08_11367 [Exophiala spinifera]|uniref:RNA 3'-terminal phosphate cyclase domain-containing protein n=1 Tax=Exophiala spinifera TaxID=91928 RepID=A0A0D2BGB9_9EURO|nr:uncharacterized protein PV08_11367 [Exophiala spinifera]KIW10404.1 hypothetical protein PV08_11367 [Exophiala spinifera]